MSKPHKFVAHGDASSYARTIHCEYCGLVVFHANSNLLTDNKVYDKAKTGCPCTPEDKGSKP